MTLNVSVNGAAVPAGGTYTAPSAGDQEVTFQIAVTGNIGASPISGPWHFLIHSIDENKDLNDPQVVFRRQAVEFKVRMAEGTHRILIAVLDAGLSQVGKQAYEEMEIIVVIPEVLPRPTLLVAIKSPEKNAFIQLKKNEKKQYYHEPVNFECEIKGGKPPFNVKWWSGSASNAELWNNTYIVLYSDTSTRSRAISFSRGGEENPVPPSGPVPHWKSPFSLPAGEHEIIVKVKDSTDTWAPDAKIKITVGVEPGKLSPTTLVTPTLPWAPTASSAKPLRPGTAIETAGARAGGLLRSAMVAEKYGIMSPALRGAINAGKRELNALVWRKANPILRKYEEDLKKESEEWKAKADAWMKAREEARKYALERIRKTSLPSIMARLPFANAATATSKISDALSQIKNDAKAEVLKTALDESFSEFQEAERKVRDLLDKETSIGNKIKDDFKNAEIVEALAQKLYVRHNLRDLPLPGNPRPTREEFIKYVVTELKPELERVIDYVAYVGSTKFGKYRAAFHGGILGLSRRAMNIGDVWTSLLYNLWNLIVGPWTIGTIFVVAQFYFMLTWIGYQPTLIFTMPALGALMMFILNFESARYPLDWITHASVGALLAQGIIIFMFALGITPNLWGWGWFWAIWFLFGLIGTFQFYFIGGHRVMFQMGMLVLLFGYAALGPYKGYWELVKDQLRAPIYTMYISAKNAVGDVWLLATNPTAWYAKQQVINVRPEQPISFPVEIETTVFEGLPPTAPAGSGFSTSIVLKNSGKIDARNIEIEFGCNEWCTSSSAGVRGGTNENPIVVKGPTHPKLQPGESQSFFISNFIAKRATGKEAEFRRARIFFNISYLYATNSSLRVQVISDGELQRKFRDREDVFKPHLATDKATSVKFSLNVGPQPLVYKEKESNKGQLLVSVSNRRPDGRIVLRTDNFDSSGKLVREADVIIIYFPKSVGSNLDCGGQNAKTTALVDKYKSLVEQGRKEDKEVVVYKMPRDAVMKPNEFQTTFAFVCTFDLAKVETQRTDFVVAELPSYTFILEKIMDIPITPPIGILFDPDEGECKNACGGGVFNACGPTECRQANEKVMKLYNDNKPRCWYDSRSGSTGDGVAKSASGKILGFITPNVCRSCGAALESDVACEVFYTEDLCNREGTQCNLNCKWVPLADLRKQGSVDTITEQQEGKCMDASKVPTAPPSGIAKGEPLKADASREAVVRRIAEWAKSEGFSEGDAVMVLKVAMRESSLAHCRDGTNNCGEENTDAVKCSVNKDDAENIDCGLFQLNKKAHSDWYRGEWCSGKTPYDIECNIRIGVAHLKNLYKDYFNDPPKHYNCLGVSYSGWDAVLRWYNGWASDCSGDPNYVSNVNDVNVPQNYLNIIAPVYAGATFGEENYCSNLPKITSDAKCSAGEGGCRSSEECEQSLECRDPGAGVKLCCPQEAVDANADANCVNEYNKIKAQIK